MDEKPKMKTIQIGLRKYNINMSAIFTEDCTNLDELGFKQRLIGKQIYHLVSVKQKATEALVNMKNENKSFKERKIASFRKNNEEKMARSIKYTKEEYGGIVANIPEYKKMMEEEAELKSVVEFLQDLYFTFQLVSSNISDMKIDMRADIKLHQNY